jgi:hypothetical protein
LAERRCGIVKGFDGHGFPLAFEQRLERGSVLV